MTEKEYLLHLGAERYLFAWVLQHYGDISFEIAKTQACRQYPYEPKSDELRLLIFHDEAWHYAMLYLHGDCYWHTYLHYEQPSKEYEEMADWVFENNIAL